MLFKGPKSLLDAITNVIKDERASYAQEQAEMDKLVAEKMLSPKQKKIAAVAGHPGKIDAADFAALRSGKQVKENSDMSDKEDKPEKPFKYNKKTGTFDKVKKMEEEVEQVDELSKGTLGSYVRKSAKQAAAAANLAGREEMSSGKNSSDKRALVNRRMGGILRATRKMEEATDTPGNGREHQCAIHVKHATMGEGKTLTTQHAEPDTDGNIAWYDVMFEHGIERVMTENLEILVSEAHTHSKKKGM